MFRLTFNRYALTIWAELEKMGYLWMARFDDDSMIKSQVKYNWFGRMRAEDKVYGYRMVVEECAPKNFAPFVNLYAHLAKIKLTSSYCSPAGSYGSVYSALFVLSL